MSDWTKEPWAEDGFVEHDTAPREYLKSDGYKDYARARACVNSLAGRVPEKLADLIEMVEECVTSPYMNPPFDTTNEAEPTIEELADRLRDALAAFRGEKM